MDPYPNWTKILSPYAFMTMIFSYMVAQRYILDGKFGWWTIVPTVAMLFFLCQWTSDYKETKEHLLQTQSQPLMLEKRVDDLERQMKLIQKQIKISETINEEGESI